MSSGLLHKICSLSGRHMRDFWCLDATLNVINQGRCTANVNRGFSAITPIAVKQLTDRNRTDSTPNHKGILFYQSVPSTCISFQELLHLMFNRGCTSRGSCQTSHQPKSFGNLKHYRYMNDLQLPCHLLCSRKFHSQHQGLAQKEKDKLDDSTPHEKKDPARSLKEDVMTIPNVLTMSRIGLSPLLGYLIIEESYTMACSLFVITGITDLLDGWIARRYPSQSSAFGSFLDPLADKFLVSVVFLSLTWVNLIPLPLTALVVSRDVGLVAAAFYVRYISMTPPITFSTYFDVTRPTAELKPMFISKLNTAIQLSLVVFTLAAPVFNYVDHVALQALWYLTACSTLTTGVAYMFTKDTYRILKEARKKSR